MKKLVCFSLLAISVPIGALICNSLGLLGNLDDLRTEGEEEMLEDEATEDSNLSTSDSDSIEAEMEKGNPQLKAWRQNLSSCDKHIFSTFMKKRRTEQKQGVVGLTIDKAKEFLKKAQEEQKSKPENERKKCKDEGKTKEEVAVKSEIAAPETGNTGNHEQEGETESIT